MNWIAETTWRRLLLGWLALLIGVMALRGIRGESLLTTTAAVSFPIALALIALVVFLAKRSASAPATD